MRQSGVVIDHLRMTFSVPRDMCRRLCVFHVRVRRSPRDIRIGAVCSKVTARRHKSDLLKIAFIDTKTPTPHVCFCRNSCRLMIMVYGYRVNFNCIEMSVLVTSRKVKPLTVSVHIFLDVPNLLNANCFCFETLAVADKNTSSLRALNMELYIYIYTQFHI